MASLFSQASCCTITRPSTLSCHIGLSQESFAGHMSYFLSSMFVGVYWLDGVKTVVQEIVLCLLEMLQCCWDVKVICFSAQ